MSPSCASTGSPGTSAEMRNTTKLASTAIAPAASSRVAMYRGTRTNLLVAPSLRLLHGCHQARGRAMDGDVRMEIRDGVAELVLDRPAKHNAVTPAMARRLLDHTRALDADDGVRAVLLRGEGERAFCAGSDLNALAAYPSAWHFRNRVEYAAAVRNTASPWPRPCRAGL